MRDAQVLPGRLIQVQVRSCVIQRHLGLTPVHLLVVERAETANRWHIRWMNWQLGGNIVLTCGVLAQILL